MGQGERREESGSKKRRGPRARGEGEGDVRRDLEALPSLMQCPAEVAEEQAIRREGEGRAWPQPPPQVGAGRRMAVGRGGRHRRPPEPMGRWGSDQTARCKCRFPRLRASTRWRHWLAALARRLLTRRSRLSTSPIALARCPRSRPLRPPRSPPSPIDLAGGIGSPPLLAALAGRLGPPPSPVALSPFARRTRSLASRRLVARASPVAIAGGSLPPPGRSEARAGRSSWWRRTRRVVRRTAVEPSGCPHSSSHPPPSATPGSVACRSASAHHADGSNQLGTLRTSNRVETFMSRGPAVATPSTSARRWGLEQSPA